MAYKTANVEIEFDIDEFDTSEMVYELVKRFKGFRKVPTAVERAEIRDAIKELSPMIDFSFIAGLPCKSLEDKMKIEFLSSVWDKYTSAQLEERLK